MATQKSSDYEIYFLEKYQKSNVAVPTFGDFSHPWYIYNHILQLYVSLSPLKSCNIRSQFWHACSNYQPTLSADSDSEETFGSINIVPRHFIEKKSDQWIYLNKCPPRKISKSMGKWYLYSIKWSKTVVVILHIYGAFAILFYFVITKTLNLSHDKCKLM